MENQIVKDASIKNNLFDLLYKGEKGTYIFNSVKGMSTKF